GAAINALAAELKSSQINLGVIDASTRATLSGLILDQQALDGLSQVKALTLVTPGTIDLFGQLSLGVVDSATGQPNLGSLVLGSRGLVENNNVQGMATFTAEQVTLQNTLGGTPGSMVPGGHLIIRAIDVLGVDVSGAATGSNNASITLGSGAVKIAGFTDVEL